ncbi:hypothetical protein [Rossellomorea sp. KS-H15a]|uniref:hypothetical protein n=1 Tax=Rossellomorea sp. KS-H15a TaxID=2963940 RepID=UPI0020C70BAB|nr:hypothetical protein [Rossellomorea sp. KS-H15a]UTE77991.1 hypothetical protein M1J35_04275 [Rossellomorea sp. KS-H15a]
MQHKQMGKNLLLFLLVSFILFIFVQPAFADVGEVDMDQNSVSKTEAGDSESGETIDGETDLPWWKRALEFGENVIEDVGDGVRDFGDWASNEWNQFKEDWPDRWDKIKGGFENAWDATSDWFSDRADDVGDFFGAVGDWFAENEWAQTVLAAVIATGAIIGAIALVATPPGWIMMAVIGAGALAGGFLYQGAAANAGAEYSFFGALSWAFAGGIAGGIAQGTGTLPFLLRLAGSSARAFPGAAVRYFSGSGLLTNMGVGSLVSGGFSFGKMILTGEGTIGDVLIDAAFGGMAAGILGPLGGQIANAWRSKNIYEILKYGVITSGYAGVDNFIVEGIKGSWDTTNILIGMAAGAGMYGIFGNVSKYLIKYGTTPSTSESDQLMDQISEEILNKSFEEPYKGFLEDNIEAPKDTTPKDATPKNKSTPEIKPLNN